MDYCLRSLKTGVPERNFHETLNPIPYTCEPATPPSSACAPSAGDVLR